MFKRGDRHYVPESTTIGNQDFVACNVMMEIHFVICKRGFISKRGMT